MFSSKTRLDATYYTPRTTKFLIFSHILVILAFSASLILSIYILLKHDPVVKIIPFIWQIISGFISIICIVLICSGIAIWATRKQHRKTLRFIVAENMIILIGLLVIVIWTMAYPPSQNKIDEMWNLSSSSALSSVKDQLGCEKQNVTDCQFRLKQFVDAQLKFLGYSGLVDVILVALTLIGTIYLLYILPPTIYEVRYAFLNNAVQNDDSEEEIFFSI
jgi:hypothetical protein